MWVETSNLCTGRGRRAAEGHARVGARAVGEAGGEARTLEAPLLVRPTLLSRVFGYKALQGHFAYIFLIIVLCW